MPSHRVRPLTRVLLVLASVLATTGIAHAQAAAQQPSVQVDVTRPPTIELYGFAMLDMGFQSGQNDPDWFDVVRPTKLPAFPKQFGEDGRFYAGVRQSRFGAKSFTPTSLGELRTTFEFELFGVGEDAGQTTFRLRHAYGELGQFGAGQYWSPFMDIDVFPNSIEYWGPTGMVFFRNVQVRWMPIQGDTRLTVALERPGASGDAGVLADRIELLDQNVQARFPMPDISGEYRFGRPWGYLEAAGILRLIEVDDLLEDDFDLDQTIWGWGLNLSSNLKPTSADTIKLQLVFGEGIQNYMNDAPQDVGIELNDEDDPRRPIKGAALPLVGLVAFLDHSWNEKFSSSVGYSFLDIDNTEGQSADAFNEGHYWIANLLHYPAPNVMVGAELQYGKRQNFSDGFSSDDFRVQFSFKYSFSASLLGRP
jgi:hypothetical protein